MSAMIPVRGELYGTEQSAFAVCGGVRDPVTGRERFRAEPALLQEFRGHWVDDQGLRPG